MTEISFRRFGVADLPEIRKTLLDVYARVYADQLHIPFDSVERFDDRLTRQVQGIKWECTMMYAAEVPIGYAYGCALAPGARWWTSQIEALPEEFTRETGNRTMGLFELMLLEEWRGRGLGKGVHDELLAGRTEERAALLCDGDGRRAMYEAWGYECVGTQKPFPDSPLFYSMVKGLA